MERITIDFTVEGKAYSLFYEEAFYDGKYTGHRLNGCIEVGDVLRPDKRLIMNMSLVGGSIHIENKDMFMGNNITGDMVLIDKIDMLVPYYLFKPTKDIQFD